MVKEHEIIFLKKIKEILKNSEKKLSFDLASLITEIETAIEAYPTGNGTPDSTQNFIEEILAYFKSELENSSHPTNEEIKNSSQPTTSEPFLKNIKTKKANESPKEIEENSEKENDSETDVFPAHQPAKQINFFRKYGKTLLTSTITGATYGFVGGAALGLAGGVFGAIPTGGISILATPIAVVILGGTGALIGGAIGLSVGFTASVMDYFKSKPTVPSRTLSADHSYITRKDNRTTNTNGINKGLGATRQQKIHSQNTKTQHPAKRNITPTVQKNLTKKSASDEVYSYSSPIIMKI